MSVILIADVWPLITLAYKIGQRRYTTHPSSMYNVQQPTKASSIQYDYR